MRRQQLAPDCQSWKVSTAAVAGFLLECRAEFERERPVLAQKNKCWSRQWAIQWPGSDRLARCMLEHQVGSAESIAHWQAPLDRRKSALGQAVK